MEEKIIRIVSESLQVQMNQINRGMMLSDIPKWDSLMSLIILSKLKETFHVDIPIEQAIQFECVGDYIDYIEGKR